MGKAIKCPACGSYYNGSIYSNCPYCSNSGTQKPVTSNQGNRGTIGIFSLFGNEPPAVPPKSTTVDKPPKKPCSDVPEGPVPKPDSDAPIKPSKKAHSDEPVEPLKKPELTLSAAISRSGRTVGKYISNSGGESIAPVVGWLVGVKGSYFGQSFNLKSGRNRIGRSHELDVKLLNDESVSRTSVAVIIFDSKAGVFSILPGESDSLCYVNNEALYERMVLTGYEEIEFGDAGLNKYIFVPFCGEKFSWSEYGNTQNK